MDPKSMLLIAVCAGIGAMAFVQGSLPLVLEKTCFLGLLVLTVVWIRLAVCQAEDEETGNERQSQPQNG